MGSSGCVWSCSRSEQREFLAELVNMCIHERLPLVMGGDYNILRHPSEKNNDIIMLDSLSCLMPLLMV
jgi:hypothetical protein